MTKFSEWLPINVAHHKCIIRSKMGVIGEL